MSNQKNNGENNPLLSADDRKKNEQQLFYNIISENRANADAMQADFESALRSIENKSINSDQHQLTVEKEKLEAFEVEKIKFIEAAKYAWTELLFSILECSPESLSSKEITKEACTQSSLTIEQMQALLKTTQCMKTHLHSGPATEAKNREELTMQIEDHRAMEKKQGRSLSKKVGTALGVFLACTIGLTVAFIAIVAVAAAATAIVSTGGLAAAPIAVGALFAAHAGIVPIITGISAAISAACAIGTEMALQEKTPVKTRVKQMNQKVFEAAEKVIEYSM